MARPELAAWIAPRSGRLRTTANLSDDAVDWMATVGLAARDYALPTLMTVLDEAGLAGRLPDEVTAYLDYALRANAETNGAIRRQAVAVGGALEGVGVTGVLLKGAAWLFEDGPSARDRMMRDLDLLIPADTVDAALPALAAAGFLPSERIGAEEGHIHARPLEHRDHPVSVEVHVALSTRPRLLSAGEVLANRVPVAPGLAVPSRPHRILHNVIHGQLLNGHLAGGVLDLRDATDVGRLVRAGSATLDWPAMAALAGERGFRPALSAALHQAAFVTGCPVPEPFAADRAARRHLGRCLIQRRWPMLDGLLRPLGHVARGLAWERDAYGLGLGEQRGLGAHLKVNRRRVARAWAGLGRLLRP